MCSLFCLIFKRLGLSRYLSVATKTQRICASPGRTYTAGIQLPHESNRRLIWDKRLVCQVLVGRQRACALGKACDKYGYSRVDSVYTALHTVTIKSETIVCFIVVTDVWSFESVTHSALSMIGIWWSSCFVSFLPSLLYFVSQVGLAHIQRTTDRGFREAHAQKKGENSCLDPREV